MKCNLVRLSVEHLRVEIVTFEMYNALLRLASEIPPLIRHDLGTWTVQPLPYSSGLYKAKADGDRQRERWSYALSPRRNRTDAMADSRTGPLLNFFQLIEICMWASLRFTADSPLVWQPCLKRAPSAPLRCQPWNSKWAANSGAHDGGAAKLASLAYRGARRAGPGGYVTGRESPSRNWMRGVRISKKTKDTSALIVEL